MDICLEMGMSHVKIVQTINGQGSQWVTAVACTLGVRILQNIEFEMLGKHGLPYI
jgi:hypothetical protein